MRSLERMILESTLILVFLASGELGREKNCNSTLKSFFTSHNTHCICSVAVLIQSCCVSAI